MSNSNQVSQVQENESEYYEKQMKVDVGTEEIDDDDDDDDNDDTYDFLGYFGISLISYLLICPYL